MKSMGEKGRAGSGERRGGEGKGSKNRMEGRKKKKGKRDGGEEEIEND